MAADLLDRVRTEIAGRLADLRPAVEEYERLVSAAQALERDGAGSAGPAQGSPGPAQGSPGRAHRSPEETPESREPEPDSPPPTSSEPSPAATQPRAEEAILAALEHGSHTVGELGVVTAMSAAVLRAGARRLLQAGRIVRTTREGRAAYALPGSE